MILNPEDISALNLIFSFTYLDPFCIFIYTFHTLFIDMLLKVEPWDERALLIDFGGHKWANYSSVRWRFFQQQCTRMSFLQDVPALGICKWIANNNNILFCFFKFIFISWRLISLQYCSGFGHTLT